MECHPLCLAVPEMTEDEYRELVEDIRANGLHDPIITFDDMILDGRHRERACQELGMIPRRLPFTGDEEQAADFVLSKNLKRRHLTQSQKALVAATLRQSGEMTHEAAAAAVGVSPRLVSTATAVLKDGAPVLVEAVRSGDVSVADAAEVVDRSPLEQERAVKAVQSGAVGTVKAAVAPKPRPAPEPEPEEDDEPEVDNEPEPEDAPLTIEDRIAEAQERFDAAMRGITDQLKVVRDLAARWGGEFLDAHKLDEMRAKLFAANQVLRDTRPYAVCTYCGAKPGGCKTCRESGYLTKNLHESAPL